MSHCTRAARTACVPHYLKGALVLGSALSFLNATALAQSDTRTRSGAAALSASVGPSKADASAAASADALTEIVVTGTSIRGDSAAYQSAPVSVITSEAIKNSGATNVEEYFRTQPAFVLSGQNSSSNTGASTGDNGTTIGGTSLNLRGIGPQYTLVLLNGRRFQSEDPANLDLIPLDAIERVEILKSGASAIYGSDAVAGVVNIISKSTADGLSVDAQYGRSGRGDDDSTTFSASWGTSTENLTYFVTAEYDRRAGVVSANRPLTANVDLSRFNPNFDYQPYPYSTPAEIYLPDGTGPLWLDPSRFGCGSYSRNPADYVPVDPHLYATGCGPALNELKRSLVNPQRRGTFFTSLDYKFANGMTVYGDFDFARSLTRSVATLYGTDGFGDPGSDVPLSPILASQYWNPFGVDLVDVTYGLPEIGPQTVHIDTSAWRLNLGLKGDLGRVHYDVGGSYYYAYANLVQYNLYSNAGIYAAEYRPGPDALNLFCNACNTPAQLAGVAAQGSIQNWEEMFVFNAHAYAPVYTLPSGDINVALGAEYRRDAYIVQPDAFMLAHGLNVDYSSPTDVGRRYAAVYVEGQLPIFGKDISFPGAASLGIDAAARFENIQSVGSTTDPTVSIRWEPLANVIAVRGSYGRSFRAPPITALYAPTTTTVYAGTTPSGQPADYLVIGGGNPDLKPETSSYTNFGVVLTPPVPGGSLTFELDRWFIRQKNIVIATDPQLVVDGIQPGGTFTDPSGKPGIYSLYMNAAGQRVNGTDFNLDYRFHTDLAGAFDLNLAGTYLNSFEVDSATGDGFVQYAGGTALSSSLSVPSGLPKARLSFAGNWTYGALSTTYQLHYSGSYTDPTIEPSVLVDHYLSHDIQFNLDLGRLLPSRAWVAPVSLSFGINDFTDARVPVFYGGRPGGFQVTGYDPSIVNPVGRVFYGAIHVALPRTKRH